MTQALAVYRPMTPKEYDDDVSEAHLKAASLARMAEAQNLYTKIGTGKHLRVEGWLTIGRAYGYTVGTGETELLRNQDGGFYGVKANAYVYDSNGVRVGQAESYCTNDEENWGDKPVAQMAGMAQTRAVSRALRQLLSWVVVLAGYSATPAEEMIASKSKVVDGTVSDLMCPIHHIEWFKRGRMQRFAHPIGKDKPAKAWCNQEDVQKDKEPSEPTEEDLDFGQDGDRVVDAPQPQRGNLWTEGGEQPISSQATDAPQRPPEATGGASAPAGEPLPVSGGIKSLNDFWGRVRERGWTPGQVHGLFKLDDGRFSMNDWVSTGKGTLDAAWATTQRELGKLGQ